MSAARRISTRQAHLPTTPTVGYQRPPLQSARSRGTTTRYIYDGFDRLSQTTYAYGTGLASSESFSYDAHDNVTTRTTRVVANTRQTLIPDLQGSLLATLDSSTGVADHARVTPYARAATARERLAD